MNIIEKVEFREYFMKDLLHLPNNLQDRFYNKVEQIEKDDNISNRILFRTKKIEMRKFRIGKYRFIFIKDNNIITFVGLLWRNHGYCDNYLSQLIKIYKNGKNY